MEVIAKITDGKFLCEVSDYELKRFMNEFGSSRDGMRVGHKIDLTEGYDFAEKAKSAMRDTNAFIASNKEIIETILKGIKLFQEEKNDNS